jgi:hypothetical protein
MPSKQGNQGIGGFSSYKFEKTEAPIEVPKNVELAAYEP